MPDGQPQLIRGLYTGVGQFDNTLIIFVCGDNGMSAEGSLNGTPNEVAYFNGLAFTVDQMLPLIPVWSTDRRASSTPGLEVFSIR
jgi:hypothetical protein